MAVSTIDSTGLTAPLTGTITATGGGSVATNTAYGTTALNANTTGNNNTAVGFQSSILNTTGTNNVALGSQTMYNTSTGSQNTAVGTLAFNANTTGSSIVSIGYQSMNNSTTASNNTAVGYQASYSNLTGTGNIAIGHQALYYNTGSNNTAMGYQALISNTTANESVAIGYNALQSSNRTSDTSARNTAVGYSAGSGLTTGQQNVILGFNAGPSSVSAANQIVIGANGVGQGDNYVTLGIGGTNYIYNQFTVNATWTKASDQRIKKNIQDVAIGLDFINDLSVKSYNWKPNNEYPKDIIGYSEENTQNLTATMYGMIAQDVKAAMDKHGYEHFGGWDVREVDGLQGVSNEMFVLPLINAVKELSAQVETMKAQIAALQGTP
jgi:hypothetical protein